uniref:Exoribonuclease phosphorolytic domain-containing protein n=1 Tax=Chloropicon laureae TaxID=464258 RepID=A0A7S3E4X2_9CHLO|mmetsp:Transcript_9318/g.23823  ORF Transcript_9318/g.23823 Transcript_9318/m.23823 type:complete len:274 (+) Transcript_9318:264-1085(+)
MVSLSVLTAVDTREETRRGHREKLAFRPVEVELGLALVGNGKVEGSARWASGGTCVTAEVKGPEATPAMAAGDAAAASGGDATTVTVKVIVRPVCGLAADREHELEDRIAKFVQSVLDRSCPPRTTVTVVVQILSEDGSLLACALNAAAVALLDAGVPLCGSPATVSIAMAQRAGSPADWVLLLEPDAREEAACEFVGTYAMLFASPGDGSGDRTQDNDNEKPSEDKGKGSMESEIVHMSCNGRATGDGTLLALSAAEKASEQMLAFMRSLFV